MRALWVLPSIDRDYGDACLATLRVPYVLRIDNAPPNENLMVSRSWNIGVIAARALEAEWVVLVSESMRFGDAGGRDFEERLDGLICDAIWGWHLIGIRMSMFDRAGLFDSAAFPVYYNETDALWRWHLAGLPSPRENDLPGRNQFADIDAWHLGTEHTITAGLVVVDLGADDQRYRAKWGGPQGSEKFTTPYNDPNHDWTWCPAPQRPVGRGRG